MGFDELAQALGAEELAFAVHGFRDAVRMEDNNVTGLESDTPLVVAGFFKNAEGKSGQFNFAAAAKLNRSEEHTSELQSPDHLVSRLLLEKKKITTNTDCNTYR